MANAANARKPEPTTLTIRVAGGNKQKSGWKAKARRAGMSLTMYVCYVMDRTELTVSMSQRPDLTAKATDRTDPTGAGTTANANAVVGPAASQTQDDATNDERDKSTRRSA